MAQDTRQGREPLPTQSTNFRWLKGTPDLESQISRDVEYSLHNELINHFQHHAPLPVILAQVFLSGLVSTIMWKWSNHDFVIPWLVVHSLIALFNILIYRRYRNTKAENQRFWYLLFCFGALINGTSWGVASGMLYTPEAQLQSFFMILIVAAIASGVCTVQVSLRLGFLAFVVPAMLLPAVIILLRFGTEGAFLSFLLLFYFGFVTFAGFNNRNMVVETIRLKFEKDQLLNQIQGSERYFRALIENASDLVVVIAANGRIVFQSPSSRTVLGYRPEELEGSNLFDFIHVNDIEDFKKAASLLHENPEQTQRGEARWLHRDGRWLILEGHGQVMDIDKDLIVLNARDVTERRAIENELRQAKIKAETANQAKSLFLANMSHEIRTPMHAILAMADVLKETSLTAQQFRYVSAFKDAGEHLLSLLNDLLDFSRIETGELKLSNAPFHLPQLIETIFDLMWSQAKNKNILLNYDIDSAIRPWHLGDPQRIRQIIVNLTNNAIKFTDDGEVLIRVMNRPEGRILIEVRDTGEGIDADDISVIFESFSQANASIGDRFGGTGLGLAICKRLVEAMNGNIWVESIKGRGSSFYCELPLPATDEPSELIDQRERDSALTAAKLPAASILVADDSAMNRMVIDEYLRYTPCEIDFASNGQEAVEKVTLYSYDLILMDLRMPVMDGLTATRLIRQRENETQAPQIPIIALTAGVMSGDRDSSIEAGCSDYLAKPVGKEALTQVLFRYLRNTENNLPQQSKAQTDDS